MQRMKNVLPCITIIITQTCYWISTVTTAVIKYNPLSTMKITLNVTRKKPTLLSLAFFLIWFYCKIKYG